MAHRLITLVAVLFDHLVVIYMYIAHIMRGSSSVHVQCICMYMYYTAEYSYDTLSLLWTCVRESYVCIYIHENIFPVCGMQHDAL